MDAEWSRLWAVARPRAYALAFRILKNREDAQDAVQETAIKSFMAFGTYRREVSFTNWAMRIVSRVCYDMLRYKKRRIYASSYQEAMLCDDTFEDVLGKDDSNFDYLVGSSATKEQIARFVRGVLSKEEYISIFMECVIEDEEYADAARKADIPLGTVRSRLHRARKTLKERHRTVDGLLQSVRAA